MIPQEVAEAFIERINTDDADGLFELMSENHSFIDSDGYVHHCSRDKMRDFLQTYFSMVPDYWIMCEQILSDGDVVAVFGRAGGTYNNDGQLKPENQWEVPTAWQAVVRGDKITA